MFNFYQCQEYPTLKKIHNIRKDEFVTGAADIFISNTDTATYRDSINIEHFKDWFQTKLFPKVPDKSVIVMIDNTKYHNATTIETKNLATARRKQQIQDWLTTHNVSFAPTMLKVELLNCARRNKVEPVYLTDVAAEHNSGTFAY
jgi:hypothetical protein